MDADITNLLNAWRTGDQAALDELSQCVYIELHLMARRHMKNERRGNVELRHFGGLNEEEIVEVLKISPRTVRRDWELARAWLTRELRHS